MNMVKLNPFQTYHALGYVRLVPIIPPDADISPTSSLHRAIGKPNDPRGKAVGVRRHDGLWSGFDWVPYEADEHDLARWNVMGAGIGIKTGLQPDGTTLIGIDADTLDADHARIIRDLVEDECGRLPVRIGRYPKALYLVRVDASYRYTRVEFGNRNAKGNLESRVEVLSDGRQFVAHGIHPATKQPYHWPRDIVALNDLPIVTPETVDRLMQRLHDTLPAASAPIREGGTTDVNQDALRGPLEAIRKAVNATPNTSAVFPSREAYRDYGYAIKAALPDHPDEALDLFQDWCARWRDGSNDPDVVNSDWRRMKPPYRRGANWLYELAEQHGENFSIAELWFDDIDENPIELNPFEAAAQKEAQREQQKRFTLIPFDEAANAATEDPAPPLIKGLIDQGTMSVLYGDSNVGKTFVAMDMAYHIATGRPYGGMKTAHGLVVYVASEGGRGAKRRLTALRDKYGAAGDRPKFLLLPSAIDLRRPDVDLNAFVGTLRDIGQPVSLIVIDTLSRALAGGDENSSVDMGALVKHFDAVRTATAAHLMIVHHTGKDRAKGARGHTLLRAATDTEIEVAEGVVSVTKQRDLDKSWTAAFALETRVVGLDADGDRLTSCTVRLDVDTAGSRREPTEGEAAVLDAIHVLSDTSDKPEGGVRMSELETWCRDNVSGMTRNALNAHLRGLRSKGRIRQPKRGFWASTHSAERQVVRSECVDLFD